MVYRVTPTASAKSDCDMPHATRAAFIRRFLPDATELLAAMVLSAVALLAAADLLAAVDSLAPPHPRAF